MSHDIRRLCVLRSGAMGDILMTTPAVRALSERFGTCDIDFIVGRGHKDVLSGIPYLRRVIEFGPRGEDVKPKNLAAFVSELRRERYDLFINFQVEPDRFYKREGLDVIAPVPINIAQATLGSKISVKAVDGTKVAIRIPAGTASGKRFRVRGQGIAKDDQKGDLIVQVEVAVPDKLTEEQEKAMKDFADASGLKY